MVRQITVSAPSKVILHGEHAVVYGRSAVAASLDLRTRMYLTPLLKENSLQVYFPDVGVKQSWSGKTICEEIFDYKPNCTNDIDPDFLAKIQIFVDANVANNEASEAMDTTDEVKELQKSSLTCFFYLYALICEKFTPMSIKVESEIPLGAGLGSSAALSVCLASGLHAIKVRKAEFDNDALAKVCQFALISEKILHGKPSGIDNTVSTYGGFVHFKQGQLKSMLDSSKNTNFSLRILLVNTKVSRKTKDLVEKVRSQHQAYPSIIEPIFDSIDAISLNFLDQIKKMEDEGDTVEKYQDLCRLVSYNQKLLNTLGVSHTSLEEVVTIAKSFGLDAKLTGAGGGGFAFILLPPFVLDAKISDVKEKLSKKGYDCYEANLGVNGVRVQFDNNLKVTEQANGNIECISQ